MCEDKCLGFVEENHTDVYAEIPLMCRSDGTAQHSLVVWVEFTSLARRGFEEQLHNNSCFYRERGGHIETKREEWQIKKWDVGDQQLKGVNTRPVFSS